MKTIAVLITCFNRAQITLKCLHALFSQNGIDDVFTLEVFLVDDNSTDGTSFFVQSEFPSVRIIYGPGNLYWNRGMILAWDTACKLFDFDYYLWLNDDTYLFPTSLELLLKYNNSVYITCGITQSSFYMKPSYGGYKNGKIIYPTGESQLADYCNGNCLLVPKYVYQKIGNLDPFFHHALGDFDYTLRASKNGIRLTVTPNYVGYCELHSDVPEWQSTKYRFYQRFNYLYKPKSGCHPFDFFRFDFRHNGIIIAFFHFFTIHLRALFPIFWKYRLK